MMTKLSALLPRRLARGVLGAGGQQLREEGGSASTVGNEGEIGFAPDDPLHLLSAFDSSEELERVPAPPIPLLGLLEHEQKYRPMEREEIDVPWHGREEIDPRESGVEEQPA